MKIRISSTFMEGWKIHRIQRTKSLMEWFQGTLSRLLKSNAVKIGLLLEHFKFLEKFTLDNSWISYLVISLGNDSQPFEANRKPKQRVWPRKKVDFECLAHVASCCFMTMFIISSSVFTFLSPYPARLETAFLGVWRLQEIKYQRIILLISRGAEGAQDHVAPGDRG